MTSPAEARELALKQLQDREPITGQYPVRLRSAPVEELELAHRAVLEAEIVADSENATDAEREDLEQAKRDLASAQEQVDATTVMFTFQGLPPEDFRDLLETFIPTDEEQKTAAEQGRGVLEYSDAFRPALVAATCTFPGFTSPDEAQAYLWQGKARLSAVEAEDMFRLALTTCQGRRQVVDWGKDSARTIG